LNSLTLFLVAFACMFGGLLLGMVLNALLPDHHLSDDSKDMVKLAIGVIATLSALVLGLLIASAKGNFDTVTNELQHTSAKIILLDRMMAQYGPETRECRDLLHRGITSALQRIWPEELHEIAITMTHQPGNDLETIQNKLQQLSRRNEAQRGLKSRALQVSAEIIDARWLLLGQFGQSSLPWPFLVVLICWLTIMFGSFGLFSPRNGTVTFVLFLCALSVAAALFLILELDQPNRGLIKISSGPLHNALAVFGQ